MIFSSILTVLVAATSVIAVPVVQVQQKRAAPTDTDILQYALTLEHLENAFCEFESACDTQSLTYLPDSGALAQFDAGAFEAAGYQSWVRDRFQQIADHEASHVAFLAGALGDAATKPCNYSFPYTDPKSFAALSAILEGVGVAAYLGAAKYITNPAYLTAAAAILTIETRHVAWVQSAVMTNSAWSGPFETPLDLDNVFSLAGMLQPSCNSNPFKLTSSL
jgi:hypothetical protein